jgi:cytochrome c peroxidase
MAAQAAPSQGPEALRAALGQRLFFDPRLSRDGSTTCATCHQPQNFFADGLPTSRGIGGQLGSRNAPSLLNAALNASQFWDGRADTLEQQALGPFLNPREMGMPDHETVVARVQADADYVRMFGSAFGGSDRQSITIDNIAHAIASYERTLVLANSAFDRFAYAGETSALSAAAQRGYRLFSGSAGCADCHQVSGARASFTDDRFHSLSVGLQRIADRLAPLTLKVAQLRQQGMTVDQVAVADAEMAELGRFIVTLNPADLGRFRTPSLRNVAETAPYMHDGSIATLEEAVDQEVYYRSSERERPMLLTLEERHDIVEFLKSLTTPAQEVMSKAPALHPGPSSKDKAAHAL